MIWPALCALRRRHLTFLPSLREAGRHIVNDALEAENTHLRVLVHALRRSVRVCAGRGALNASELESLHLPLEGPLQVPAAVSAGPAGARSEAGGAGPDGAAQNKA